LTNVTIAGNAGFSTGGVYNSLGATIEACNTIIADNTAPVTTPPTTSPDFQGVLSSQGYNLIESTERTTITGNTTGNFLGQDPQLMPLGNYGGPTQTHALRLTSPAIDKGNSFGVTTDQRAQPRPFDNPNIPNATGSDGTDIGAFERQNLDKAYSTLFDFDGDGKSDFSIFRPSLGEWWYYRSSDGNNRAFQFGTATDVMTPGDYTGDGKTDVAFYRNGIWYILRSEDFSYYAFPFGLAYDIPAPADYDGDGHTDAAVFRSSENKFYVLKSTGGVVTQVLLSAGTGAVPVSADYNGDGKADFALFSASSKKYIIWAIGGVTLLVQDPQKSVPMDFDGDGKMDMGFYDPQTGRWYISRFGGSRAYSALFGDPGDIPAPADYDGDGKMDLAVYRPSTGTWWYAASSEGRQHRAVQFGISTDKPVPAAFVR
jgi:hypothetical protein